MAQMVCPHCGHEEYNEVTPNSIFVDENIYECTSKFCGEVFTEPIEDYEFNEAAKEARDEDRADEARDMEN